MGGGNRGKVNENPVRTLRSQWRGFQWKEEYLEGPSDRPCRQVAAASKKRRKHSSDWSEVEQWND